MLCCVNVIACFELFVLRMLLFRCRCESVRKIIERVFGMLKKRFRILRLPMLVQDMSDVEDIVKTCCVLHNMGMQVTCSRSYKSLLAHIQ